MFNYGKKKRRMQMVQQGLRATSKSSLKLQCLFCAKGDLKEAKELYDFFADDMPNLPEHDPVPLTWQQNTAQTVNGIMGWLKENQGTLAQAYDFIEGLIKRRSAAVAAADATEAVAASLPPINQ
jgi:hypothetical protein